MRMWMINPKLLCRNHLLGEHNEIHKHRHNFVKHHRIDGRINPVVLIEPRSMETRHNELANEMIRRGYKHQSPYSQPDISYLPAHYQSAIVDREVSKKELKQRCPNCKQKNENN